MIRVDWGHSPNPQCTQPRPPRFVDLFLLNTDCVLFLQLSSQLISYNAENGHPSCANDFLLNTVRRKPSNPFQLFLFNTETPFRFLICLAASHLPRPWPSQILRGEFKADAGYNFPLSSPSYH